jgi:hypothetical protein
MSVKLTDESCSQEFADHAALGEHLTKHCGTYTSVHLKMDNDNFE